jgi:hypothetical protein
MVCQNTVGGQAEDLAVYRPSLTSWTVIPGGIQSTVKDGTTCSNGIERSVIVQFMCNATATTTTNFTILENPPCTYTITLQTNLTCGASTALGLGSSSSSSSSTGAVVVSGGSSSSSSLSQTDKILIGVLVGVGVPLLVLVCCLLVYCALARRGNKQAAEKPTVGSPHRIEDEEENSSRQAGVEMESY